MKTRRKRDGFHPGLLVSGVLLLVCASFFAWKAATALFRSPIGSWTGVSCRIESSRVERRDVDDFVFTAAYSFFWNRRRHHATCLDRPGCQSFGFDHLEERLPLLEKYAPGTVHVCHVEPGSDGNAVLPVESPSGNGNPGRGATAALAGILAPLFLLAALAGLRLTAGAFPWTRRLLDERARKALAALVPALGGLPFAVAGGSLLAVVVPTSGLSGANPVAVSGTVLYSGIHTTTAARSFTYSPRVGYEYVFRGKTYESDRVCGFGGECASSNLRGVRETADSHPPGSAVEVWVLPGDPPRATLRPAAGALAECGALGAGLLFLFAGLAVSGTGVFSLVRVLHRKRDRRTGPWNLRRSRTALLSFGAFAVFWNLLSWSVAFMSLGSPWPHEPASWLVCAFPLVGIGLAVSLAVALRRELHAPKLSMTLALPDGTAPVLDWRLDNPSAVRSLAMRLEGRAHPGTHPKKGKLSLPVCRHATPVPGSGRETFRFPGGTGAGNWRLAATLQTASSRRAVRFEYPLPDDAFD